MGSADQPLAASPVPPPAAPTEESLFRFVFFNERELRAGWRLLLYLFLALVVAIGLSVFAAGTNVNAVITAPAVIVSQLIFVIAVLVPAIIMGRYEKRTLGDYGLPERAAFGRNFWLGAAWGIAALTLVLLALRINGSFLFGQVGLAWKSALLYGVLWALAMYLVGLGEEFLFRGYVQFTLTDGLRFLEARLGLLKPHWVFAVVALLTSLLFSLAHTGNPGEKSVFMGSVVLIGLFFCFTLYRTGSLWFAIGMHASWNWGQTFLYGVPNSGVVAQGHLLNPTIQGPWWYSGGTVGPEGSILMVPLIVLMFVVFDRTFPKGARYPALTLAGHQQTPSPVGTLENSPPL